MRKFLLPVACCLLAVMPTQSKSQSVLEIAAGIKFCKTLTDDPTRLKCYDGLFTDKEPPVSEKPKIEASWDITENKSPIDDSPQVSGLLAADGGAGLVLRCKEKKTEAIFSKQFSYFGSSNGLKVLVRINDGKPIETEWSPSTTGQAVFAPAAVQFIRALPENGKLFIRATVYNGSNADGEFNLGAVSVLRDKIAAACRWPTASAPTPARGAAPTVQRQN
jgi:hypothetical protein